MNLPSVKRINDLAIPDRAALLDQFQEALEQEPSSFDAKVLPVKHYLTGNGLYAREIFLPEGTVVTGRIKKSEFITVVSAGLISEVTNGGLRNICAPHTMTDLPGTRRIVWAHTDSVLVTIHKTDCTNIQDIEDDLACYSYSDAPNFLDYIGD